MPHIRVCDFKERSNIQALQTNSQPAHMEWHEYDQTTRRDRALFHVPNEHFAFLDHADILQIQMIDPLNGYIVLKTRRRRAFFSKQILPDANHFFFLRKNKTPTPTHAPPAWCADLAAKLH
jgi:hypothetical protein